MLLWIAGNGEPVCFTGFAVHDANFCRRRRLAYRGILYRDNSGINRVRIVDHIKVTDRIGVNIPIRNMAAVGAPLKSIPAGQLFFIGPVKRAIDEFASAVGGQGFDPSRSKVFHIEILLTYIGGLFSIRRKFGKHQG